MKILYKSIRLSDYKNQKIIDKEIPNSFDYYVVDLIEYIGNNTSVREYKTLSNSKEVIGCILAMCANLDQTQFILNKMNTIAQRLLQKEIEAQKKIERINRTVQKGSLIQALLFDDSVETYSYLLAKVEHTEWVDDMDFSFKTGFPRDKKTMWKSCLFDLSDLNADYFQAKIYSDTKAQYWSGKFLELEEMNSDETNTLRAFKTIDTILGRELKGINGPNYTIIRNSFIGYFKNNEYIDYPIMVHSILDNYQPVDTDLTPEEVQNMSQEIQTIKYQLLEQPKKRNFDSQFNVVNSAINARIKRVYPITNGIDLRVTQDIKDLSNTIQSVEEDGVRYIKIRTNNNETYNQFHF